MSEVFQVESVQSCVRDMFLLLAPDSLWHCLFYRKGTRKNSSWEGEGINAFCQLIGQWVTDSLNRGIDLRKEIDLWLLQWKGKKRSFHTSINKKTKGPVIRERIKLQRITGINSLILIEKIRERWEDPYTWLRKNFRRATKSCYYPQIKDHTVVDDI